MGYWSWVFGPSTAQRISDIDADHSNNPSWSEQAENKGQFEDSSVCNSEQEKCNGSGHGFRGWLKNRVACIALGPPRHSTRPERWLLNISKIYYLYLIIMDNRPIKGNASGKYTVVLDPTNDIASYYDGMH